MSELYSLRCPLCDQIALHFRSLAGEMFVASNIISSLSLRPNGEVFCQDCRRLLPPIDETGHYMDVGAVYEGPPTSLCECNVWKEGEGRRQCPVGRS
jgi:hypothetical protein